MLNYEKKSKPKETMILNEWTTIKSVVTLFWYSILVYFFERNILFYLFVHILVWRYAKIIQNLIENIRTNNALLNIKSLNLNIMLYMFMLEKCSNRLIQFNSFNNKHFQIKIFFHVVVLKLKIALHKSTRTKK